MKSIKNIYKKFKSELVLLTVMFLFFFQLVGDLIESIYVLELLGMGMDEKVLGLFFILTPVIMLAFRRKIPNYFYEATIVVTIVARLISPFLNSATKIIVSGLGVGCFMLFLPSNYSQGIKHNSIENEEKLSLKFGAGLASAILLSITFRTLNSTADISTYGVFQIIGWVLAIVVFLIIINQSKEKQSGKSRNNLNESSPISQGEEGSKTKQRFKGVKLLSLGLFSVLTLNYFAFTSPTVISRWTEGDYIAITIAIAVVIAITTFILTFKPNILSKLNSRILWVWNGIFVLSLVLTIAVHTFPFPANPTSNTVIINRPIGWYYYIPLVIMIGLLPIIFIDFTLLSRKLINQKPSPSKLGAGFATGGLFLMLMSLILIFTNVWGYVEPVSNIFRNLFWLPFLLVGLAIPIMGKAIFKERLLEFKSLFTNVRDKKIVASFLVLLLIGTSVSALVWELRPKIQDTSGITSITVMSYNIRQGVDFWGDKNFDNQLAIIKAVNPDIIGLQESDTARISYNNMDITRYFATHLNYYCFYGPRTVTGTFGAAILSRYPILNAKTFFSYSNVDEIGTTEVQIRIGADIFNIYVNHPDGNADAKTAHMQDLLDHISGKTNVISLGDFNFRNDTVYYSNIVAELQDTWVNASSRGVIGTYDLATRIDYIFVSPTFTVLETQYINNFESDHPAVWTEIQF
ncbi:MAG: endonuclease/exonuclease/phosphatase family protein [Candidatus Hodarchaeota archaeon]